MHEDRVRLELGDDGVATVTMVRADKHNALDDRMMQALLATADRLAGTDDLRAVVLQGEGRSFCSGLDVPSFAPDGHSQWTIDDVLVTEEGEVGNRAQRLALDWLELPVPVIAALHGNVFGGGLQIALGADIRVCAPDAKLSVMEAKWGLIPDMGITRTLPRVVSIDVAKELTFTARIVPGEQALALGLVTRLDAAPQAAALKLAREIAEKSPAAIRRAKHLFDASWTADAATSLALEERLQREIIGAALPG
jgi:enoyl-CoA hydratase/carnithine racemase